MNIETERKFLVRDDSFKAQAGTHHLVVDLRAKTIAFDTADGIVPVMHNVSSTMYSPSGHAVLNPQPGQIVIMDGRKYVIE